MDRVTTHLLLTVLNEAPVIVRCIRSAIDAGCEAVIVLDTGCTDDTIALASAYCEGRGIPFYSRRHAWHGYANARNVLLDASRDLDDQAYSLMLDADEVVTGTIPQHLTEAGYYTCRLLSGQWEVWNIKLTFNRFPWRYIGEIHEVACLGGFNPTKCRGFELTNLNDGRQGTFDPEAVRQRYLNDAAHFGRLLEVNPQDSRAAYYKAQSLMDAGQTYEAMQAFAVRAKMEHGFGEERYLAAWRCGQLCEMMHMREAKAAYEMARVLRPWRHESIDSECRFLIATGETVWASELALYAQAGCGLEGREDLFLLNRELYNPSYWDRYIIGGTNGN